MKNAARRLLRRLLLWAFAPELARLEAVRAQADRIEKSAKSALYAAHSARKRAECITSIDVPVYKDHGIITITAIVSGQTIVKGYVVPPMALCDFKELLGTLQDHYGAVDFVDAPAFAIPPLRDLLGLWQT